MIKASKNDKNRVIDILCDSFEDNRSVNYIIKQDGKRKQRLRALMDYSFDVCYHFGDVFLSDDKNACALILYPDQKDFVRSTLLDLRLIFRCIGPENVFKALKRESAIKSNYPDKNIYYLWFIGVNRAEQGRGIGGMLLESLIKHASEKMRPVFLETSTLRNIPWYEKYGFENFHKLDLGYTLYMFRKTFAGQ